jgi:hypothetical protein
VTQSLPFLPLENAFAYRANEDSGKEIDRVIEMPFNVPVKKRLV